MHKLKAIGSIILMSALLISVTGITVSRHYCMGTLVESGFYNSSTCCAEGDKTCHEEKSTSRDCCNNEVYSVPGIKVLNHSSKTFTLEQLTVAPKITGLIHVPVPVLSEAFNQKNHSPPLYPDKDILILVQRFLI